MRKVNEIYAGLTLEEVSSACPEQYDVFDSDGSTVGYLRLRYGMFSVEYPNVFGDLLLNVEVGDCYAGRFYSDFERTQYLNKAKLCIANRIYEDERKNNESE